MLTISSDNLDLQKEKWIIKQNKIKWNTVYAMPSIKNNSNILSRSTCSSLNEDLTSNLITNNQKQKEFFFSLEWCKRVIFQKCQAKTIVKRNLVHCSLQYTLLLSCMNARYKRTQLQQLTFKLKWTWRMLPQNTLLCQTKRFLLIPFKA